MLRPFAPAFAIVLSIAAAASARDGASGAPAGLRELTEMYPGVRASFDQGRVRAIYGMPMTWGGTPDAAVSQFLQFHAGAFGAGPLTLQPAWSTEVQNGRFTAYAYRQFIDGLPVEFGNARVLVLNGAVPRVVYAAGTLAAKPAGGWPAATITGAQALQVVQGMDAFGGMPALTSPTAAVWQGDWPTTTPRRAWKFQGFAPQIGAAKSYTFFVDMATGGLLEARNEVYETDVTGTVRGWSTPGVLPDITTNPPQLVAMPEIQMSIQGGASVHSARDGTFTIPNAGSSAVTVQSNLSNGRWVNVNPTGATELSLSMNVTPPGNPDAYVYNGPQPTPANSMNTAQVNAFVHTGYIHNYYKDRAPGFTAIDNVLPANTGVAGTCNAFFTTGPPLSINFYNLGGGCNNSAYSTVVAHEYGHYVVNRLELLQGSFGEGFSDVGAILLYDTPIVGENFYTNGTHIRNPATANQQYPCGGGSHMCGQVLGGVWWETLVLFKNKYGSGPGLDKTRDLQVAWAMITNGGSGSNSAHPTTAIEVLTVDDDDGIVTNGTPNYADICNAFDQHNIDCPPLQMVQYLYPSGVPTLVTPNLPTTVRVDIVPIAGVVTPGTARVFYSLGTAPFQNAALTSIGVNQYEATIPATPCLTDVRFYFSVGTSGGTVLDPPAGATAAFKAISAQAVITVFSDTFETDKGWVGVGPGDNAATGRWNRMDPEPTQASPTSALAQPGDDMTAAPGVACWVTDGHAGLSMSDFDVDAGQTTLMSPILDLSSQPGARIGYWRWYSNNQNGFINDTLIVGISNNGGTTWTIAELVGPVSSQTAGGWFYHEFRVADFVTPTANMRMRFLASDIGSASLVEAAVDDFRVIGYNCAPPCYPDCNLDQGLSIADFACFQSKFAAGDPYADCNGQGGLTIADFACFQSKFVAGCP